MKLSYYELSMLVDAVKANKAALEEEKKSFEQSDLKDATHWAEINESWIKDYSALLKRLEEEREKQLAQQPPCIGI